MKGGFVYRSPILTIRDEDVSDRKGHWWGCISGYERYWHMPPRGSRFWLCLSEEDPGDELHAEQITSLLAWGLHYQLFSKGVPRHPYTFWYWIELED